MHRPAISLLATLLCSLSLCLASQTAKQPSASPERWLGTWAGSWEGAGQSGKIEITVTKDEGGKLAGKVAATTEGGDYTAKFTSLAIDANKLTAKYDFPADEQAEVVLEATLDAASVKGTWSLRPKGQTSESVGGSWTATKK